MRVFFHGVKYMIIVMREDLLFNIGYGWILVVGDVHPIRVHTTPRQTLGAWVSNEACALCGVSLKWRVLLVAFH